MSALLRKYATATHVYVPVIKRGLADFAVGADWTPATGDVKVSIDGGAAANVGTLPVAIAMGNGAIWDFVFTTGEITGKKILITVADSATKAVEDQAIMIDTFGNASAEYPFDLSVASQVVASVTGAVGSVTGSVGSVTGAVGSVTGAVGSVTGNVGGSTASVVGAVGSVTGNVGGNVTGSVGSVVGAVGSVTGAVASVTGNVGGNVTGSTGSVASGGITTASFAAGAINAAAIATDAIGAAELAADAATEIATAVWAITMTELAAVPGVTDTVLKALEWVFLAHRNKITQTATTTLLRNNADNATIGTSTVSDDGTTFTRSVFS